MKQVDWNNVLQVFNEYVETGMKRGDGPIESSDLYSPALVENDGGYIDVEYILKLDGKIYTREEINSLKKILK